MSTPLSQERGALSNLPTKDYVTPDPEREPTVRYMNGVEQEDTDIATGMLNGVMESAIEGGPDHIPPQDDHPWFKQRPLRTGVARACEMIVEGMLRKGHNAFSGSRGAGKSSTIVPLGCAIGGLIPDYPLDIPIRRVVVMITEDYDQVCDIIQAMREDRYLTASNVEIDKWFRLVDSKRLTTKQITEAAGEFSKLWTPNERADGSILKAHPLVILDTVSANIDIENSNSNDEVGSDVVTIREKLSEVNMLLVGHTAKSANGVAQTMIGAQAWEANTIGSATLVKKENSRESHIEVTKHRFETDCTKYRIESRTARFDGVDALGHPAVIRGRYNILHPMTAQEIQEVTAQSKEADRVAQSLIDQDTLIAQLTMMLAAVDDDGNPKHPKGVKKGDLYDALKGGDRRYKPVIEALDKKKISVLPDGKTEYVNLLTNDMEVI